MGSQTVGFLTNAGAETVTTSYTLANALALTSDSAVDGAENALVQGVYLDHVEIHGVASGGAVATLTGYLSWDAEGDYPATNEGTFTLIAGLSTSTILSASSLIQMWARPPGRTLTLYLHLKTNANSFVVGIGRARLHWTDSFGR